MARVVPQPGQLFVDGEGRRWVVDGVVYLGAANRRRHFIVSLKLTGIAEGEVVLSSADFNLLVERGALRPLLH